MIIVYFFINVLVGASNSRAGRFFLIYFVIKQKSVGTLGLSIEGIAKHPTENKQLPHAEPDIIV